MAASHLLLVKIIVIFVSSNRLMQGPDLLTQVTAHNLATFQEPNLSLFLVK